jgi:hypothetical protein
VAIRVESDLCRAGHLKRLMVTFFPALVLILAVACGGEEKQDEG